MCGNGVGTGMERPLTRRRLDQIHADRVQGDIESFEAALGRVREIRIERLFAMEPLRPVTLSPWAFAWFEASRKYGLLKHS